MQQTSTLVGSKGIGATLTLKLGHKYAPCITEARRRMSKCYHDTSQVADKLDLKPESPADLSDMVVVRSELNVVERNIDLIYGGGSLGLMGLVSQTVYDGGCHVLGVIPTALVPVEVEVLMTSYQISGHAVGEVLIVSDMHERKAEMARRADAFIALPGGYGTMEELLEMITWSQLGIHEKPVS
ncbi:hypothetical protein F0562_001315 [Nyssa sinensis]|uniref:Cytokinin riboside 5'-monophosphate phosphoribohydrolase n=1 Tax=Nyssa sinensis TaxID=561372 RepID=A0A5J5C706_9ASTE|nr:hypothetical protein F0562_001315 [Nyssa sinensis]